MRAIYSIDVILPYVIGPNRHDFRRTFWFSTLEQRYTFKTICEERGWPVAGFNLDHALTAGEAVREIEKDIEMMRVHRGATVAEYAG